MANQHARLISKIYNAKLVAGCDIDKARVEDFCTRHVIKTASTDANEILNRQDIDAIIVATPDRIHTDIAIAGLEHGKHVLCEKPLAVNYPDATRMAEVAEKSGKMNMVNFSYRDSSAIQWAHKYVQEGRLGRIMHVEASYLQSWLSTNAWGDWRTSPGWLWRLSSKHGSGGVLADIGVHILDFTSYAAGKITSVSCKLKTFHKAENDRIGEYILDANDSAIITAEFEGGALGTIHTSRFTAPYQNRLALQIYGEEGTLKIDLDQSCSHFEFSKIKNRKAGPWRTIDCKKTPNNHRRFIRSIRTGIQEQPDFRRGAEIQKIIDACFESDKTDKTIQVQGLAPA